MHFLKRKKRARNNLDRKEDGPREEDHQGYKLIELSILKWRPASPAGKAQDGGKSSGSKGDKDVTVTGSRAALPRGEADRRLAAPHSSSMLGAGTDWACSCQKPSVQVCRRGSSAGPCQAALRGGHDCLLAKRPHSG